MRMSIGLKYTDDREYERLGTADLINEMQVKLGE